MIEFTIKLASFCLDLLIDLFNGGIIIVDVNPSRETTRINSKNVNPFSKKEFFLRNLR